MNDLDTAKQILYGNSYPKPLNELTFRDGANLCIEVRAIRDSVNRLLAKHYKFSEVRDMPLHKQLDMLQALVLISTLKEKEDAANNQNAKTIPPVKSGSGFHSSRYVSKQHVLPDSNNDIDDIPF